MPQWKYNNTRAARGGREKKEGRKGGGRETRAFQGLFFNWRLVWTLFTVWQHSGAGHPAGREEVLGGGSGGGAGGEGGGAGGGSGVVGVDLRRGGRLD